MIRFAPRTALKLTAIGKLTFDGKVVPRRVVPCCTIRESSTRLVSQNVYIKWFEKVSSPVKSSTYWFLLLIEVGLLQIKGRGPRAQGG